MSLLSVRQTLPSTVTVGVPDSTPAGNYTVTVIASGEGQEAKVSSVVSVLSANLIAGNVTVSGRASSAALYLWATSLISIQFIDTQTGTNTSYDFNFPPPPTLNPFGNYTVTLLNQHTYNVTISYYGYGPSGSSYMEQFSDYIGSFTVALPTGQTQITKNFG